MHQRFVAPRTYVQGAGALDDAAEAFDGLGTDRAFVLGGETALAAAESRLVDGIETAGTDVGAVSRGVTACTDSTVETHVGRVENTGADLVVGVGGGVAMDVATAVATRTDAALAAVPTVASTDAPCSTVAVIYDEAGTFLRTDLRDRNPELVLVDTAVVAGAPARFLAAGMGDALATHFEARAVGRSGAETVAGGTSSFAARDVAETALERVEAYGPDALAAVERDAVTPAVERVVEANTLLSGLGFESGGTAGAHAVQIGLTNVGVRAPHGVLVAFGTIAELVLEDAPPETLARALDAVFAVGLDRTLAEFDAADADLTRVGEIAVANGMGDEPIDPSPARVADAVRTADELVARRRQA
ncbi:MAG: iron-containing alcohol dehydrogenase [Halobacteriaceae archaeon]